MARSDCPCSQAAEDIGDVWRGESLHVLLPPAVWWRKRAGPPKETGVVSIATRLGDALLNANRGRHPNMADHRVVPTRWSERICLAAGI